MFSNPTPGASLNSPILGAIFNRGFIALERYDINKPPCAKSAGYCRMGHGTEAKTALVLPLPVPGLGLGCSFQ